MKADNQPTILIVDDRPMNLKVLFSFLQEEGFKVLVAKTGKSALEKLQKIVPDLILLDVMMPDLDGFETCLRLKKNANTQDIPVIFMTALSEKSDKVKGLNVGAVDYITKPLIKEEVLARINIHLKLKTVTSKLKEKNHLLEREIRDRQQAEEQLRYRLELEKALAQVSKELATREAADLNQVLAILGVTVGVNRAYITRFRENSTFAYMSHEWCDDRTPPNIQNYTNVDTSAFPWWVEKYRRNENAVISDLDALPPEAEIEKNLLKSVGVCSVLAVPINTTSGELWGAIAFETTGTNRKNWSDEDVRLLQVVSEMIYSYCARQQARENLRASEALYSSIFNHSAEAIFLVNVLPDGQFVYETINPNHEQKTGISATEMAGKTPAEVISPAIADRVSERYRACIDAGVPISYEETLEMPGGTRIWRTILVPIRDGMGRIVKLQGSGRDITEEKQAEAEKLRQTQHRQLLSSLTLKIRESLQIDEILKTTVTELQKTLLADRVLFFRLLPDEGVKVVNEAVAFNEVTTSLGTVISDKNLLNEWWANYQDGTIHVFRDGESTSLPPRYLEYMHQAGIKSTAIVPILMTVDGGGVSNSTPIQQSNDDLKNHLWGLLCVQQCSHAREWTPLEVELLQQLANQLSIALYQAQLLENQIHYAHEMARSNAELEQFAYIASHDLQAPLGTVASYAELFNERYQDTIDEKGKKFISKILQATVRMQTLIDDLLLYSRVSRSQKPFEPTDCNLVFEEACANLGFSIRKNQAVVTKADLPIVTGDRSQLVQLFQNLISNGIKYRREEPPIIRINIYPQEEAWLFSVTDNGIGVDPKYGDRIFQIFQRLHTQEEYSGTGIGLAISQKIVEHHGGRIWLDSQPGQGATFYFTLPLKHP